MGDQTPSLSAEGEIRNTIVRACQYMDDREFRQLADLFTEDAVNGTAHGREEIYLRYSNGDLGKDPTLRRKHIVPNSYVKFSSENVATVVSDFVMFDLGADGYTVRTGRYHDVLRRQQDSRWLIEARRLSWLESPDAQQ